MPVNPQEPRPVPLTPPRRDAEPRAGHLDGLGVLMLVGATVSWALTNLFVKYLTSHYGNVTQNFYRYLFASLLLWIIAGHVAPHEVRTHARHWYKFLPLVAALVPFQLFLVAGLGYLEPGFVSLTQNTTVIFVAVLAYMFISEERPLIRSPRYVLGTGLALLGAAGLVLTAPGTKIGGVNPWALCVVASTACWAAYTVLARRLMKRANALVSFAYVATFAAALFGIVAFLREGLAVVAWTPRLFLAQDPTVLTWMPVVGVAVLAGSGWLCLALAHWFYYEALNRLGAAVCGTFLLTVPLITVALSYLIRGERLRLVQVVLGVGILIGAYQTLAVRGRATP